MIFKKFKTNGSRVLLMIVTCCFLSAIFNLYFILIHKTEINKIQNRTNEDQMLINNDKVCPQITDNSSLFMLVVIISHADNYIRRKTARETWLSENNLPGSQIRHIFIIGTDPKSKDATDLVRKESRIYNDLLVIREADTYRNVFFKHLAMVEWVTKNCINVRFIFKCDDDVVGNLKLLKSDLIENFNDRNTGENGFIYCFFYHKMRVMRDKKDKW